MYSLCAGSYSGVNHLNMIVQDTFSSYIELQRHNPWLWTYGDDITEPMDYTYSNTFQLDYLCCCEGNTLGKLWVQALYLTISTSMRTGYWARLADQIAL